MGGCHAEPSRRPYLHVCRDCISNQHEAGNDSANYWSHRTICDGGDTLSFITQDRTLLHPNLKLQAVTHALADGDSAKTSFHVSADDQYSLWAQGSAWTVQIG